MFVDVLVVVAGDEVDGLSLVVEVDLAFDASPLLSMAIAMISLASSSDRRRWLVAGFSRGEVTVASSLAEGKVGFVVVSFLGVCAVVAVFVVDVVVALAAPIVVVDVVTMAELEIASRLVGWVVAEDAVDGVVDVVVDVAVVVALEVDAVIAVVDGEVVVVVNGVVVVVVSVFGPL